MTRYAKSKGMVFAMLLTVFSLSLTIPVLADNSYLITGFQPLSRPEKYHVFSAHEKPSLNTVLSALPESLTAYLDGSPEPVSIPVTWFCVGENYEETDSYYYQFRPVWDEQQYILDRGIDFLRDAPCVGLFLTEEETALFSVTGSANETAVYQYLTDTMGLNSAAACGVMANIQAESGFYPQALGDGGTSYGICQWHNSRWNSLRDYCEQYGYDSTTLTGQLHYLQYELETGYPGVLNSVRNVSDSADGAYTAASVWCISFEIPADKYNVAVVRGNLARDRYWPEYGGKDDPSAISVAVTAHEAADSTEVSVTVSGSAKNAVIFCGLYTNDGKMLAVESQRISETQNYNFRFEHTPFERVQVFILDGNLSPLCASKNL